ncbi:MAG: UDP-galactopyranose mutase [Lachnospiraceae bacterium]|nr:UDP-galactopyranose mutase [Lachnospiraceae bacterium]
MKETVYDWLIVGAGLFGAVFAHEKTAQGQKCLVIDKRSHIAGNIYTEKVNGINVHKYGAHIFHTSDKEVWSYVNRFAEFNNFVNSPMAVYHDELYNLPFNMNTFSRMWNIKTPAEAREKIESQIKDLNIKEPKNLEEQALSLVGTDIYEKLIKGYTQKQWGRECKDLPASIIRRLPVRFTYNNNYFNDHFQGIPMGGYTQIAEKLLEGSDVKLNCEFADFKAQAAKEGIGWKRILFTGPIDEYYGYSLGRLEYRSLRFETEYLPEEENYQGNAVVNYTEAEIPYTRIIEHKHFDPADEAKGTYITREYPLKYTGVEEPYYPMGDAGNTELYDKYRELADKDPEVVFGGRLGLYKYFDMDKIIRAALDCAKEN